MKPQAVIAPKPTRRRRAALFEVYVIVATVAFIVLALAARFIPYFPIDVTITQAVQGIDSVAFDRAMHAISWIGFFPQSLISGLALCAIIFAVGLRWEAVATLIAACSVFVAESIKLVVSRPRPSIDLVEVIRELASTSFPSGHVMTTTAICGFLAFLSYTLLKRSWERDALIVVFAALIGLMGVSRIHQGHHWFSDVVGAYLLGSLWLLLVIEIYRRGKTRYFVRQPMAPERPATTR